MNLDQLLGALSVDQLQDMAAAWAPDEPVSRSKLELFRILRDKMVRPECAARCLEHCGRLERGIARKLLRSANVSQPVVVLAASASERPRSLDDTRAAVAELVAMGLACVEPEKRWEAYGSARVTIADELIGSVRRRASTTACGRRCSAWRGIWTRGRARNRPISSQSRPRAPNGWRRCPSR